ncbi:hypothetical protein PWEIH_02117 [Listeria weihenstephanensis FSL R9-0317]|uniref:hypothetical protein n=1 Tax=Listeria weihenstephanensis TaxID=1006155 RepID=UPI0003E85BD6|nr:hypothetical protein [Listeria weihenstephanensis]EUJ41065.1 hypothetical protein PWEIH_02117 [Listeria weihenstephanensis FSL R9-0317]
MKYWILKKYYEEKDGDFVIKQAFFSEPMRVPNEYRYDIKVEANKKITIHEIESGELGKFNGMKLDEALSGKAYPNVILLLESPHVDEYNICNGELKPIAPAQGKTGSNIKEYLGKVLSGIDVLDEGKYRLYIINPVPFQTSLRSLKPAGQIDGKLRDKVWKKLWGASCKNEFKELWDQIRETKLIINACTSNLKEEVEEAIKDMDVESYKTYHPSRWSKSPFGIKKSKI